MAIVIRSMVEGHRQLLAAAPGNHEVIVTGIRVRDAAAVQEMLHARRWRVRNTKAFGKLVRADAVLALLEGSVLPAISDNPHNGAWVDELYRMVHRLEVLGNQAGGYFSNGTNYVVKAARKLGVQLRSGRCSAAARGQRARKLVRKITTIRDEDVTIDAVDP